LHNKILFFKYTPEISAGGRAAAQGSAILGAPCLSSHFMICDFIVSLYYILCLNSYTTLDTFRAKTTSSPMRCRHLKSLRLKRYRTYDSEKSTKLIKDPLQQLQCIIADIIISYLSLQALTSPDSVLLLCSDYSTGIARKDL